MRTLSFPHRQHRTEHTACQREAEHAQHGAAVEPSSDQKTRQQQDRRQAKRTEQAFYDPPLLLRCGGRCAIRRRPDRGLLAGLWEFPGLESRETAESLRALFPEALAVTPMGPARHVFTHVEWHMEGFLIELPRETEGFVWEPPEAIRARYSFPTALKAYLRQIE